MVAIQVSTSSGKAYAKGKLSPHKSTDITSMVHIGAVVVIVLVVADVNEGARLGFDLLGVGEVADSHRQ